MTPAFKSAFDYLVREDEGNAFTNDPRDPGGPTKYGITQETLAGWRGEPVSAKDVEMLTHVGASAIYFERYWKPTGCNRLRNAEMAIAIFSASVLFGVVTVVRLAQHAVNDLGFDLVADGHAGPKTAGALNSCAPDKFVLSFCAYLTDHVIGLVKRNPDLARYKKGWLARIDRYHSLLDT